jgi:multidrug efflux pump subunit AcrA (membrane-fusion protein)
MHNHVCFSVVTAKCMLIAACAQVDLVRAHQEYKAVQHVKQQSSAFAVALPGAQGSALQARSNDAKRNERLVTRISKLLMKLQMQPPIDNSTAEYKAALSSLRDAEVMQAQQQIEAEVSALAALRLDRQRLEFASKITRSLTKRATRRRNRVRGLVAVISRWQQATNIPSSSVMGRLPAAWSEADIKQLFTGSYPWQATGGGVLSVLAEQYRDACAEVRVSTRRCSLADTA